MDYEEFHHQVSRLWSCCAETEDALIVFAKAVAELLFNPPVKVATTPVAVTTGVGSQVAFPSTRKSVVWTAKADCQHCHGHGLLRSEYDGAVTSKHKGVSFPFIVGMVRLGVTTPTRIVCGCVESDGE